MIVGDLVVDQIRSQTLERGKCARFIGAHLPAVTDHVSGENRGQTALSYHSITVLAQVSPPPKTTIST